MKPEHERAGLRVPELYATRRDILNEAGVGDWDKANRYRWRMARAFAALNGWKLTNLDTTGCGEAHSTRLEQLTGKGTDCYWLDHAEFYNDVNGEPVAIVCHNYDGHWPTVEPAEVVPLPWSWYYPARTTAFCVLLK